MSIYVFWYNIDYMDFETLVRLLRVHQWYKNLVVYLALFFTRNAFQPLLLWKSTLAFVALCFLSSSYYILNDIRDAEADRRHPEKKGRPIASGAVSARGGYVLSIMLLFLSFAIGLSLPALFNTIVILLFVSSLAYNLKLKDYAFIDLHVIAVNFLLRAMGGAVAIGVPSSPWLVTTVFFTALLLGISKRRSELILLGGDAHKFKKAYADYSLELLNMLLVIVSSILLFSYILYTFFVHPEGYMMLTIPFASFVIFRYLHFSLMNHKMARKTHYIIYDRQLVIAFILWAATIFALIYLMKL